MSDFDDLDSLLGPLREPATPAELASERAMIDLMVTSHRNPKGTPMFSSRRARVATFIAAGVIGFGGVAAAGGGLNDSGSTPAVTPEVEVEVEEIDDVEEVEVEEVEVVEETSTTSSSTTTTTTAAAAIEESDDDTFTDEIAKATLAAVAQETGDVNNPDTVFDENLCLDGNHGKTVSAVARGELKIDDIEVRDAAHSDCGKTADDATKVDDDDADVEVDDDADVEVDEDDSDEDDSDEDDSDEDDSAEEAGRGSKGGNGNGNGKSGNGNGKSGNDD